MQFTRSPQRYTRVRLYHQPGHIPNSDSVRVGEASPPGEASRREALLP
ncbi:hypothetical protein G7B40_017495 [Aetokthonos hydrillicola Thurmond2011]|uniref:Uncharacterized protein n=1 Tax=Aetokthonos hydrillicola Thurmond2011 TaxID=2712845 RepID=A0AAP5IAT9_9CYAN|nr:hypothetical protein [Aetokthonos hydrillicola CCALA 1050]MBW4584377.1 hypothetical protein [Aetokthonos hydrillicola CCALA 1050]MDR9896338.1 hypothetical protein [Aetokthonos hydrillicola Thurmond2011]